MTKREIALANARVAGYHQDRRTFTRLRVESRVHVQYLNAAWHAGQKAKAAGVPCDCRECKS